MSVVAPLPPVPANPTALPVTCPPAADAARAAVSRTAAGVIGLTR